MTENPKSGVAGWVGYRPDIRILDCSVRDGGLINDHQFDDGFVKSVYATAVEAGVDYFEIGYKASKRIYAPSEHGAWKYCDEDAVRRIVGDNPTGPKVTVMADVDRTDYKTDILPREKTVIGCVRVACYIHQIPAAMDMIADATEKGHETMLQLMAVSTVPESELRAGLELAARCSAQAVYIVDSFGAMYSEQVRQLTALYMGMLKGTDKEVGFHGHNNRQLAFANTVEAIVSGANRVDATISGIGRGAGNCPMELLIGFLHNPKFKQRPVLKCCRDVFLPLSKKMDWGYSIPYAITAQLNLHPREAIAMRASENPDDYVAFFDQIVQEE